MPSGSIDAGDDAQRGEHRASRLPDSTSILAPQMRSASAMKARPFLRIAAARRWRSPCSVPTRMRCRTARESGRSAASALLDGVRRPAGRWSAPRGRDRRSTFSLKIGVGERVRPS